MDDNQTAFGELVRRGPYARELVPMIGARASCPDSVFEIAVISLLLQNTTIARTTHMFRSLLVDYGCIVTFDRVTLRAFFTPEEVGAVDEEQFRVRNRLGYRAKYIPAFAEFFSGFDNERALRLDGREDLMAELEAIKGIGPYSANVIVSSALRDTSAVPLDVWNVRILSRVLLGADDRERAEVLYALTQIFPSYEGLASLYFIERQYLETPLDPLRGTVSEARRASRARLEA